MQRIGDEAPLGEKFRHQRAAQTIEIDRDPEAQGPEENDQAGSLLEGFGWYWNRRRPRQTGPNRSFGADTSNTLTLFGRSRFVQDLAKRFRLERVGRPDHFVGLIHGATTW